MHTGMYQFVFYDWHLDLHGYGSRLSFSPLGVVSSYARSCFLYFTKVMAFFSNSPPNDRLYTFH